MAKVYLEDMPDVTGLSYGTSRAYHNRAMQRRRALAAGRAWAHLSGDDFPEPDGHDPNPDGPRPKPFWCHPGGALEIWAAGHQRGGGRPRASGEPAQPRKTVRRRPGPRPRPRAAPPPGSQPAAAPATGDVTP